MVRTERNWTNYYAFCRSGMTNTIKRIRDSAAMDMYILIYSADDDQFEFMINDPLLPQFLKGEPFEKVRDWRWKFYRHYL